MANKKGCVRKIESYYNIERNLKYQRKNTQTKQSKMFLNAKNLNSKVILIINEKRKKMPENK